MAYGTYKYDVGIAKNYLNHEEFEKYRIKQNKLYKSDFDLLLEEVKDKEGGYND